MNDHLVVRPIEISKPWYITIHKMMKFHKIDHFEILMVMSHKSFIIFDLGPIWPASYPFALSKIHQDSMKNLSSSLASNK